MNLFSLKYSDVLVCCKDAFLDVYELVLFLFIVFVIIELIEYFFFDKFRNFALNFKYLSPFIFSVFASLPQCGFSVLSAILYLRGYITKGTLIATFIATSDEAIPVFLTNNESLKSILPLIILKIIAGTVAGYLIDFTFSKKNIEIKYDNFKTDGCCGHEIDKKTKKDLFFHPILHTINISLFIFVILFIFNILLQIFQYQNINLEKISSPYIQIFLISLFGLIPNCAVSVAIALLYIKKAILFSSAFSGLSTGGGLGIWVLIKNNKISDSVSVLTFLFIFSVFFACLIHIFGFKFGL